MTNKVKILFLAVVLTTGALLSFTKAAPPAETRKCDASNPNKCVIYNVGEGTGALVYEQ